MSATDKFFEKKAPAAKTKAPAKTRSQRELQGETIVRDENNKVDKKASYYNVSLRLPKDLEEPIKEITWANRENMTQYVARLIREDLAKAEKAKARKK